jgi:Uma2 family endonuclease
MDKKWNFYRDDMGVTEYFLFDPTQDYLKPSVQGFCLVNKEYISIEPVDGRLPSDILGLHLEKDGREILLYDPTRGSWLPKCSKKVDAERQRAEAELTAR